MNRVAVIGARGQLGSAVVKEMSGRGWDVFPLSWSDPGGDVESNLVLFPYDDRLDAVINCAAIHRFEECEEHPKQAFKTNAIGARHVAQWCKRHDTLNVYISTDAVLEPVNVYAISKLAGERMTEAYSDKYLIVRFGSLFGGVPTRKGPSFVDQVLLKAAVGEDLCIPMDQVTTPAYTKDVARLLAVSVENYNCPRAMNLSNLGDCSYYEFALEIVKQAGYQVKVFPTTTEDPHRVRGRHIQPSLGFRTWQDALAEYLKYKEWNDCARERRFYASS